MRRQFIEAQDRALMWHDGHGGRVSMTAPQGCRISFWQNCRVSYFRASVVLSLMVGAIVGFGAKYDQYVIDQARASTIQDTSGLNKDSQTPLGQFRMSVDRLRADGVARAISNTVPSTAEFDLNIWLLQQRAANGSDVNAAAYGCVVASYEAMRGAYEAWADVASDVMVLSLSPEEAVASGALEAQERAMSYREFGVAARAYADALEAFPQDVADRLHSAGYAVGYVPHAERIAGVDVQDVGAGLRQRAAMAEANAGLMQFVTHHANELSLQDGEITATDPDVLDGFFERCRVIDDVADDAHRSVSPSLADADDWFVIQTVRSQRRGQAPTEDGMVTAIVNPIELCLLRMRIEERAQIRHPVSQSISAFMLERESELEAFIIAWDRAVHPPASLASLLRLDDASLNAMIASWRTLNDAGDAWLEACEEYPAVMRDLFEVYGVDESFRQRFDEQALLVIRDDEARLRGELQATSHMCDAFEWILAHRETLRARGDQLLVPTESLRAEWRALQESVNWRALPKGLRQTNRMMTKLPAVE
ncbi:MAG: hypothetical protein AAF432_11245 [Planctomycetota bacterium]